MKLNSLKEKLTVSVSDFSKYRGVLMGLATIMILIVHSFECNVDYPNVLNGLLKKTYVGVDIFLFVSGLGIWYSLSKNDSFIEFCKRRMMKILPVFLPIFALFSLWKFWGGSIAEYIRYVSTLAYWQNGTGVWYVALIFPLYLITPFFYKLYKKSKYPLILTYIIITSLIIVCEILLKYESIALCANIAFAFKRTPSYFIGILFGRWATENKKISLPLTFFGSIILYVIVNKCISYDYDKFPLMLFVTCLIVIIMQFVRIKPINTFFNWFGTISLESYLFNDALLEIAFYYNIITKPSGTNNDVIAYLAIVLLGTAFAYGYHYFILPRIEKILCIKRGKI